MPTRFCSSFIVRAEEGERFLLLVGILFFVENSCSFWSKNAKSGFRGLFVCFVWVFCCFLFFHEY